MEVACAGKVLVTGGYLILYPEYSGLVMSTSCTITSTLQPIVTESPVISIHSPHFNKTWTFPWAVPTADQEADNPFVCAAVGTVVKLADLYLLSHTSFSIVISADEAFYGDGKSGLGSSAAVICSLVSVMLKHLGLTSRSLLHFACQLANSKAQNKVGSGFDIAACIFGSHVFRRIQCPELSTLTAVSITQSLDQLTIEELNRLVSAYPWDQVESFSLPQAYHLVLAPMGQGSNTRILAASVIKWFQAQQNIGDTQTAKPLFDCLQAINTEILKVLTLQDDERLKSLGNEMRGLQRQLSELSGVEVLPEEIGIRLQTVLQQCPEVVLCGVPGAGGYDAAYFIVRSDSWEEAKLKVESALPGVTCLHCQAR